MRSSSPVDRPTADRRLRPPNASPPLQCRIAAAPSDGDDAVDPIPRLALGREALAAALDCSEAHVDRQDAAGLIPDAFRLGTRKLWSVQEIQDWIAAGAPDRKTWLALKSEGRLQKA